MRLVPPTPEDLPFLWEMLARAALPGGGELPPGLMADDHIRRYLDGWGRPGDAGLVAWEGDLPRGAAWLRLLPPERPGYGYVEAETPELSIAVVETARGRGVGRALVTGTLDQAAAHGRDRVSLSVAGTNVVAAGLYRSLGFTEVGQNDGGSTTMVAPTAPAPPATGDEPTARLATEADGPAVARLRRVMFGGFGGTGGSVDDGWVDDGWVDPLLALWPDEVGAGRWVGALASGPGGRPVASALAVLSVSPPGPGRERGRAAHVGSVATDPAWRRRGAARAAVALLLAELDRRGVESSTLSASPDGADLYVELGFRPGAGTPMRRNATNR